MNAKQKLNNTKQQLNLLIAALLRYSEDLTRWLATGDRPINWQDPLVFEVDLALTIEKSAGLISATYKQLLTELKGASNETDEN